MVEVLSRDVKPLKAPQGAPNDPGQCYLLIDPSVRADAGPKQGGDGPG